jgi:hypothetical protein
MEIVQAAQIPVKIKAASQSQMNKLNPQTYKLKL